MSLSARIMNLPHMVADGHESDAFCRGFKLGHRDARRAAAELAAEADAIRDELVAALEEARAMLAAASACAGIGSPEAAAKWWARKGDVGVAALARARLQK